MTRGPLISEQVDAMTEVASDGRTVWVNLDNQCVARFCPVSHEYMQSITDVETRRHETAGPSVDDWESFKHGVDHRFHVTVTDVHQPKKLRT